MVRGLFRSSRPEVFCKKGVLRNFAKLTGKYFCQGLRPATLLKKRLSHRCFPGDFAKFFKTDILEKTFEQLCLFLNKK